MAFSGFKMKILLFIVTVLLHDLGVISKWIMLWVVELFFRAILV